MYFLRDGWMHKTWLFVVGEEEEVGSLFFYMIKSILSYIDIYRIYQDGSEGKVEWQKSQMESIAFDQKCHNN
jgi:hypothetical protein